jgi:hypothetical protein
MLKRFLDWLWARRLRNRLRKVGIHAEHRHGRSIAEVMGILITEEEATQTFKIMEEEPQLPDEVRRALDHDWEQAEQ